MLMLLVSNTRRFVSMSVMFWMTAKPVGKLVPNENATVAMKSVLKKELAKASFAVIPLMTWK